MSSSLVTNATMRMGAPQRGQVSASTWKMRASSLAHAVRFVRGGSGVTGSLGGAEPAEDGQGNASWAAGAGGVRCAGTTSLRAVA